MNPLFQFMNAREGQEDNPMPRSLCMTPGSCLLPACFLGLGESKRLQIYCGTISDLSAISRWCLVSVRYIAAILFVRTNHLSPILQALAYYYYYNYHFIHF